MNGVKQSGNNFYCVVPKYVDSNFNTKFRIMELEKSEHCHYGNKKCGNNYRFDLIGKEEIFLIITPIA